jgi:hypothetical protein
MIIIIIIVILLGPLLTQYAIGSTPIGPASCQDGAVFGLNTLTKDYYHGVDPE